MLRRIVSGGQTGADRGALDAALRSGFACGGWCPRGRKAEDGPIPERYPLTEMDSAAYIARTRRNVEESDGTLILAHGTPTGGTRATLAHARRTGRPVLVIDLDDRDRAVVEEIRVWIADAGIETLNVAGPRESGSPGIAAEAEEIVAAVLVSSRKRS